MELQGVAVYTTGAAYDTRDRRRDEEPALGRLRERALALCAARLQRGAAAASLFAIAAPLPTAITRAALRRCG